MFLWWRDSAAMLDVATADTQEKQVILYFCLSITVCNKCSSTALYLFLYCIWCSALWKIHWWKCALRFEVGWNVKEHLFLQTSGEELFLMSALCGLPSTFFDLFLESNVMIVANFEIWKHSCYVSLQSCFARFSLALHTALCCFSYLFIKQGSSDEILWTASQPSYH